MTSDNRSSSRSAHRSRRTDLFLIRIWTEEVADALDVADGTDGTDGRVDTWKIACRGRVQRVVDGKSCSFDGLQNLTPTLAAMLSGTTPKTSIDAPQSED